MNTITVEVAEPTSRRAEVATQLLTAITHADVQRWAVQGDADALARWAAADDARDLDLWVSAADHATIVDVLRDAGAVLVRSSHRAPRLRHDQWWFPAAGTHAVVDVTVGDLRVGPLLLVPDHVVGTAPVAVETTSANRLTGIALVFDLAVRPLLRGRLVDGLRLQHARVEWSALSSIDRAAAGALLKGALGAVAAAGVHRWLDGAQAPTDLVARVRRHLLVASLRPRALRSTWLDRRTILPTRSPSPLGFRRRGVVVALVGTDGSGKSTVAAALAHELQAAGYDVEHAYFGMARANLPGLATLRRLVRGSDEDAVAAAPHRDASPDSSRDARRDARRPGTSWARRAGAWVYAADYTWRALTRLWPGRRAGRVVIADRWVTDLRRTPSPGSPAAAVAEWLVGPPDVFAVADAPAQVIAARKAERTIDEIVAEQASLRSLVGAVDGRRARGRTTTAMVVPTDRSVQESVAPLVAAVVAAVHR